MVFIFPVHDQVLTVFLIVTTLFPWAWCPQLFCLEERRRLCLEELATLIQKIYRGWKCRTHFLLLKKSQVVVAAWYRRYAVSFFYYTLRTIIVTTSLLSFS